MRVTDLFTLNERQQEFVKVCSDPKVKEALICGSIRSGKSQVCARILVSWAMQHPGLYMACRATYRELEDSTKRIFLNGDGALPPAIPPEIIADNGRAISKQDQKVRLINGSEILFRSLEESEKGKSKIRNITLSGAFIDQLEEFDGEFARQMYQEVVSRCSHPIGPRKVISAANPGAETHWAYDRLVNPDTRLDVSRYVHVTLFDNEVNLPDDYVVWAKRQESENPDFYERFILGKWGAFGGKRFKSFRKDRHVVPFSELPSDYRSWEIIEGIDFGYANPFAAVWVGIDYDGRWWVLNEHYQTEEPISFHATRIREIRERLGISPTYTFIDPSTFNRQRAEFESVAFELQQYGIQCGRGQNERLGGWARLDELLTERLDDGKPRLLITDACPNLIRELVSARFKEGTDDIEKENDHALDALRYVVMTRPPSPVRGIPELPTRQARIEALVKSQHERALGRRERVYFG